MTRPTLSRALWCGAVAALVLLGSGVALAQPPVDPALQGRVLRRSDGTLYVYRDGQRYRIVPAELSDAQIDAIPEAGLLVERLGDLFALVGATSLPATPAPLAPPVTSASFDAAVAGLTGQTLRACDLLGLPVDVVVERVDPARGIDGHVHLVVLVSTTNAGARAAQALLPLQLRDDQNRRFDISSVGLSDDLMALARQYGLARPYPPELPPGVAVGQLWAFQVADDVQALTLSPNPLSRCG